jgi:uncharacterized membrane protein YecN with MAPEG domain
LKLLLVLHLLLRLLWCCLQEGLLLLAVLLHGSSCSCSKVTERAGGLARGWQLLAVLHVLFLVLQGTRAVLRSS